MRSNPITMKHIFTFILVSLTFISQAQPVSCTELFNGTTDNVSVGNIGARPTDGAIAFWMKATASTSQYPSVLSTGGNYDGDPTGNRCIRFEVNGSGPGTFGAVVGSDAALGLTGYTSGLYTSALTLNTWHHVVLNWSSTANTIIGYLDGVQVFTTPCTTWPSNFNDFRIGQGFNASRLWSGSLDDVSVWNKQLTGAEITGLINSTINTGDAALRAYYNFEGITTDGAGITVLNRSVATAGTYNGTTVGTSCTPKNSCAIRNCNLALWLKADSAVTYNGSNLVSQWKDVSGNNRHVSQGVVAMQPTFTIAGVGNKPSLYFDGTAGKYFLNNTTQDVVPAGTARTAFIVGKRDCKIHPLGNTGGALLTFKRTTLINALEFGTDLNFSGSAVYVYSDGVTGINNATIANNASDTLLKPFQLTYKVPASGGKLGLNLNGITYPITQAGNVVTETGLTGFTVGHREDATAEANWNGFISEVIVYQGLLTNAEIANVENYLNQKYFINGNSPFNALPTASQTASDNFSDDGFFKHTYKATAPNAVIASVRDNCNALGARTDVVYADANASLNGGKYTMRRHYVINVVSDPPGTKRVRLYYTNADFTNLQAVVPSLTSASQLVITKYDGLNEDGVYDPSGGTLTFIPAAQITTGTAFGQNYLEFDVAGFSEFWIHTGSAALPLKFLSFTALNCDKNEVCLNWKTANEQNVSHFEIERSVDGIVFKTVGTKTANNQPTNSYSATDDISVLQDSRQIFYRIKQIDADGKFTYSSVQIVKPYSKNSITVFPNPAVNTITVSGVNNIIQMKLYDISGRVLSEWKTSVPQINVGSLQKGTYILKVELKNGDVLQEKIIKI